MSDHVWEICFADAIPEQCIQHNREIENLGEAVLPLTDPVAWDEGDCKPGTWECSIFVTSDRWPGATIVDPLLTSLGATVCLVRSAHTEVV
jgi:hypothetical protein